MRNTRHPRVQTVSVPFGWLGIGLLGSLALVAILVLSTGSSAYAMVGLLDPGPVTKVGTYVLRFLFDIAGAACAGALVYAAFFTTSKPTNGLSADGWAAVRLGGVAAWVWFGSALALIPFDAADATGIGVLDVLSPAGMLSSFSALYGPTAWLISGVLALVVALCCHVVFRWRAAIALAAIAVVGLLPPVTVGNASAGLAHDYAMNALVYHVIAAALWLGVLVALVAHLWRGSGDPELALRRYRSFALGCWLVLGASGFVVVLLLVSPEQLLVTHYGRVTLGKIAGLLLLGVVGVLVRRRLTHTAHLRRAAMRLAAVEVVLILLTTAVAIGTTQTPPPAWFGPQLSSVEVALGYSLPGPPTLVNLLTVWRFDLLLGVAGMAAAVAYLAAVRHLRHRGEYWSVVRTVLWLAGCVLVAMATSSGLGAYTPASFSVHMASHMTLNMLAPLLLVLGAPVTLALRALPAASRGEAPRAREWLIALTTSRLARVLSHPGLASAVFVASYYLLYLTPLFEAALSEHWSRMVLNLVTLAIGYQFYWIVVGVDASPRHFPHLGRLGMVFAVMPFHAVFAVIVMSVPTPIAANHFLTLDLPWIGNLLADQRTGGVISLIAGEVALVAAQVVLLMQWYRHDRLAGFRSGPLDGNDHDAAAYQAMLDKLKQTRGA